MTTELKVTIAEHAAGNYRVMMNACRRDRARATRLDEKLYFDLLQPAAPAKGSRLPVLTSVNLRSEAQLPAFLVCRQGESESGDDAKEVGDSARLGAGGGWGELDRNRIRSDAKPAG